MNPVRPKVKVAGTRLEPEHYRLRDFLTRIAHILTGPDLLEAGKRPECWSLDRDPHPLETSANSRESLGPIRPCGSRP